MLYSRTYRSILFTPAVKPERFTKAFAASADICLVDLEDSVASSDKGLARKLAEGFFADRSCGATARRAVRINAVGEPDGHRDLLAFLDYERGPDIVMIPKVESPRDIEIVECTIARKFPHVEFMAVIETPRGLENATAIARASDRMCALIFGSADYSFSIGCQRTWDALLPVRSRLVNSARSAGVEVIDAPTFQLADRELLEFEATEGKRLGFSGKAAIHPRQVSVIVEKFSPDKETLQLAERIVNSSDASANSVTVVDGMMVGRPFFEAAHRLVRQFGTVDR